MWRVINAYSIGITREQWQPYIEAVRQRSALPELTPAQQEQREQLLVRVRQVAAELKSRFNAKRVILFGSLVHAEWFVPGSDVNLAVEGLRAQDLLAGLAIGRGDHWASAGGSHRD